MIKINLIPPYKKAEIRQAKMLRLFLRWEIELSGIIFIFIMMLFSISYILQLNLASLSSVAANAEGRGDKIVKLVQYDEKIKNTNKAISEILKIQKGQLHWIKFFEKLNGNFSEKITVSSISINNYEIAISGEAKMRNDLIDFKNKIENDSCFLKVDLPLSSLINRENVEFKMSFEIKEECVKT